MCHLLKGNIRQVSHCQAAPDHDPSRASAPQLRESLKGIGGDGRRFSFSVAAARQQLITGLYVSGHFCGAAAPGMLSGVD